MGFRNSGGLSLFFLSLSDFFFFLAENWLVPAMYIRDVRLKILTMRNHQKCTGNCPTGTSILQELGLELTS